MGSSDSESIGAGPLVGITAYGERAAYLVWDHDAVVLPAVYVQRVADAGGTPVLLPPVAAAVGAVDALDALVLSGGPDVGPARYGAPAHPRTGDPRDARDAAEIAVVARALERGIPVLAVCRGLQVLNVALGGTLTQHLPDVVGHDRHSPVPGEFGTTTVTLEAGSRVAAALGPTVHGRCHHHQGVDRLGEGLVVTGTAPDGTIEAVELPGPAHVVGVQWHPEQDDPRLFSALVAAAQERTRTWRGSPAARP